MSKVQMLRVFVNQRLTAAAEEIFGLFERTIAEYEEMYRLHDAQRSRIHRVKAASHNVTKFNGEVTPEQQDWSSGLLQQDPEPPHIKENLWSSQEGEQLQGLEEADVMFTFTPVPVKSEEDEETPPSSRLHQRQTEQMEDGRHCGGPELDRNSDPERNSYKTSSSSETEESNNGLKQRREPQSDLNALKNSDVSVSDMGCKSFSCSECSQKFDSKDHLQIHKKSHTGEKTFTCQYCGKKFTKSSNLTTHLRVHTGEKPFTCSVCNTSFSLRCTLVNHMRVHTGEKPFSCSVCSKGFSKKTNLTSHMALHTEEKPFKCNVCDQRFTWHSQVKNHKCVVDSSR